MGSKLGLRTKFYGTELIVIILGVAIIINSPGSISSAELSEIKKSDRLLLKNRDTSTLKESNTGNSVINAFSNSADSKKSQTNKAGTNSSPQVSPFSTRLPTNIIPTKYFVKIQPILEPSNEFLQWTAPGEVTISFSVVENTDTIVLHTCNMSILQTNVKFTAKGSKEMLGLKSQIQNEKEQTYKIITEKEMKKDEEYEITIPFVAALLGKNVGLYGFMYPDPDATGNEAEPKMRRAAASQFQPYHAREAFPCFDEPQLKALFEISIGRKENYQTFSNTKIASTMPDMVSKGWMWDTYEITPVMSTNVVQIVVVDGYTNEVADESISSKAKIQVWAPKIVIEQGSAKYAVNQTAHIFKYFEEYFDIPYPLDKLDSVLVWQTDGPAMEHWGSITYGFGGVSLLYLPEMTPEWKRLNIVGLIAHEVLHQWMGNLVSVDWWSDIWLHEGFAEYFADMVVAKVQPEFQSSVLFVNSHFQRALRADQQKESHPVKCISSMSKSKEQNGEDDDDDDDIDSFDDIAYSKGASLVRMMNIFLTEPVFQDGMRTFVKKFANKAVNQDDLFDAMNSVIPANALPAGVTLKQIMDTWTLQPGYPVVTVTPVGPDTIQLSQEKFKTGKPEDKNHSHWWIPIKIVTSENSNIPETPQVWLSKANHELKYSNNIDTSKWLIVNPDATGYFRAMYDLSIQDKIKAQLDMDHTVFSPMTRSQLLDDYFTFAALNYVPIEEALELTSYLGKEKELVVWDVIFTHLSIAINMFSSNAEFDGLQKYLIPKIDAVLTSPEVNLEKMQSQKGSVVLFQMELLKYGCMLQSPACFKYISTAMDSWMTMKQANPIPLDLQPTMYCAGVASGNKTVWDFMKGIYDQTPPSEQKMILFKALTCSQDAATLGLMLEENWLKDNMMSPTQVLEAMANNPIGKMLVFEFLKANFLKMMPVNFVRILNMLSEYWVDPEQISDLENFVKANPDFFASEKDEINDEIESHKDNAKWMNDMGKRMDVWFNSHSLSSNNM